MVETERQKNADFPNKIRVYLCPSAAFFAFLVVKSFDLLQMAEVLRTL